MKEALFKEAKAKILELLKVRGEMSADELTNSLQWAKSTIRQHLLLLEKQGLVHHTKRKVARGRPVAVYGLSKGAGTFFPSQEPALLRELLASLIADGQSKWVGEFFNRYWEQRIQKFKSRLEAHKRPTRETARIVLFELLKEEGFMPELSEDRNGAVVIRECNCPFPEAVKATRIPCRLEAAFINQALGQEFRRTSYIPMGASTCTYESQPAKKRSVDE